MSDPYLDITEAIEWVIEPPLDIWYAMNAAIDADLGLNEEFD